MNDKHSLKGRDPITDDDVGFHSSLMEHEDTLRLLGMEALRSENAALFALITKGFDEAPVAESTARSRLAEESAGLKRYTASQALSDLEQQSEQALIARAGVARKQAEADKRWPQLQALAADLDQAARLHVFAAYAAGAELVTRQLPALKGRELWPLFPSAVVADKSGAYLPVVAAPDKGATQVKVQLKDGREEWRAITPQQLLPLRRDHSEWRGYSGGSGGGSAGARLGCEARCGKPEKTLLVLWDEAQGAFAVVAPGEVKPDPKVTGSHDVTQRLEREVLQQRLLLKEPERQALSALLGSAKSPVERVALVRTFCINGEGAEALAGATQLLRMLDAMTLATSASFDRAAWLGANGLAHRFAALQVIGPYELMWAYANPLAALQWVAGGDALMTLHHDGLEATTATRLINRELAHRVARSRVRYVELRGESAQLQPRLEQLLGQWVEGVLAETSDGVRLSLDKRRSGTREEFVWLSKDGLQTTDEANLRSLLIRAIAVASESDEARSKIEKVLRHALAASPPKHGVIVGFVAPGQDHTSAGVAIEGAELWTAMSVDVRGSAVVYKLQRWGSGEEWTAKLDELLLGRPSGAQLQFVEMVPKRGK